MHPNGAGPEPAAPGPGRSAAAGEVLCGWQPQEHETLRRATACPLLSGRQGGPRGVLPGIRPRHSLHCSPAAHRGRRIFEDAGHERGDERSSWARSPTTGNFLFRLGVVCWQVLAFVADRLKNEQPGITSRVLSSTAGQLSPRLTAVHIPLLDAMRQNASRLGDKGTNPVEPIAKRLAAARLARFSVEELLSDDLMRWALKELTRSIYSCTCPNAMPVYKPPMVLMRVFPADITLLQSRSLWW